MWTERESVPLHRAVCFIWINSLPTDLSAAYGIWWKTAGINVVWKEKCSNTWKLFFGSYLFYEILLALLLKTRSSALLWQLQSVQTKRNIHVLKTFNAQCTRERLLRSTDIGTEHSFKHLEVVVTSSWDWQIKHKTYLRPMSSKETVKG